MCDADLIAMLCRWLPYREMGWKEIGETFYRWVALTTPWMVVYIHYVDAKQWHKECHDHPWDFWALILAGGYWEDFRGRRDWQRPLTLLYRPARSRHNVMTPTRSWSLVVRGRTKRKWGFKTCEV